MYSLCSLDCESVTGPLGDQVALELREHREHSCHCATARRAHIEALLDDDERPSAGLRTLDDCGEIEQAPREPIEPRNDQDTRLSTIEAQERVL